MNYGKKFGITVEHLDNTKGLEMSDTFEGGFTDGQIVLAKKFAELYGMIDYLKNELDEVRALYCEKLSPADPQKVAEKWRWDCFDNGKNAWLLPESKRTMDRLVELGEELEANHNNQKYKVTDGE
jgi:hypothetical protein